MKSFVVLRSLETGEVHWGINTGRNPERMADGTIGYAVVQYADSEAEATQAWQNALNVVPECDANCDEPACPYIH